MRLPSIQPVSQTDIYVSGEVIIHETAMIASGVILQASPGRQIRIGEGVCLGMGVVISASEGDIEIVSGAVLGAGVLMTGSGKIDKNACIGASSTLIKSSVAAQSVIPSGSLVGDDSRQVAIAPVAEFSDTSASSTSSVGNGNGKQAAPPEDLWQDPPPPVAEIAKEEDLADLEPEIEPEIEPEAVEEAVELTPQPSPQPENSQPVVGQMYINQLLVKLFPEREAFKRSQDNQSSG